MSPIRVGILGLNAQSSWAVHAHLPYLAKSSKYEIVALCNSSVSKAQEAIQAHSLPSSVKAYGNPADLANDPDVDLVVCSVRVDRHYETLLPAVKAGKDVFCEWPLASNLAQAEELARIAKEKGAKTMVGLQATRSPLVTTVKELVEQGRIGKVLSTTMIGSAYNGGKQESDGLRYTSIRETGGNIFTIHFAHSIEAVLYALGEIASFSSILETQWKTVEVTDKVLTDPSRKVIDTITRDSPDQILIHGHLTSGALFSYHLRGGRHFGTEEGLIWRIYGEKGEIIVTGEAVVLQVGSKYDKIRISNLDGSEPQEVPFEKETEYKGAAMNVAALYESFAEGRKDEYRDWDAAVLRHRLIDEVYKREQQGKQDLKAEYLQG